MGVKQKSFEKSMGLSPLLLALRSLATRIPKVILRRIEEEFPEARTGTVKLPQSQASCLRKVQSEKNCGVGREISVTSHSENVQDTQEQYPNMCYVCNKNLRDKNTLELHLKVKHSDLIYCKICDELCKDVSKLNEHYKIHWQNWQYECRVCGKKFRINQYLKFHMKIHSDTYPFQCKICRKRLGDIKSLKLHYFIHNEQKCVCNICNKNFKCKQHMKWHVPSHKNEKPFACTHCNKHFRTMYHLQRHISAVHLHERKYECIECGKKFSRNERLNRHIRVTHRGEKPYVCNECNATFAYKHKLQYHCRKHLDIR